MFPRLFLLFRTAALMPPAMAMASRSGLNNVPDSDVSAPGTGVVQFYSNFGQDRDSTFLTGLRLGFEPCRQQMELGWDARWEPGDPSHAFFNGKWRFQLDDRGDAVAVGFANAAPFAGDREITGEPQLYAVGTVDAGFIRIHAGAALQHDNNSVFCGVDHTFLVHGTKLKFRADLTTIRDGEDLMGSAGFTWRLSRHMNLELWESWPAADGVEPYTTAKAGFHFEF